ncbi:hypothetical protein QLS91_02075 [Flavobacterium sp. LB2P84]|uniref:hypothetical protein n=1 Tax=Flavobacterium yafengii TaxID=3041253 RepID=UPI0024A806FF|nr:hypothetical protein [Flavobacterium yafengii]MDI6031852.1 hypothetical protein [Flavobacterium yafengii]
MKKYLLKITAIALFIGVIAGCESESVVFDNVNGQEGVQFTTRSYNITVPTEGIKVTIPVSVTTISDVARTYQAVADEKSTGAAVSYAIGVANIPAGSYDGTLDVTLNTNSLQDGIAYALLVKLVAPTGGSAFNNVATINYNKKVVCNNVVLTVTTDAYAEETSWKIVNAAGVVVASIPPGTYGPASSAASRGKVYTHNINLPNGKYSLIMEDVYCDGQFDGTYSGGYKLDCSIIKHASGTGAYGCTKVTNFEINP